MVARKGVIVKHDTETKLVIGGVVLWGLLILAVNVAIIWVIIHFIAKYW